MLQTSDLSRMILSQLNDGVLAYDRELRYLYWSPVLEKMTGLKAADVLGHKVFELFPVLVEIGEDKNFRRALAGETCKTSWHPFNDPSNPLAPRYETHYSPLRNEDGVIIGGISVSRSLNDDIVFDHHHFESLALLRGEERFRTLIDEIPQIIWVCDPNGTNTFTNRYGLNYFGLDSSQHPEISWADFIFPDDRKAMLEKWESCLREGTLFEIESRLRCVRDGTYRWSMIRGFPMRNTSGQITEWVATAADTHEQKVTTGQVMQLQTITALLSVALTAQEVTSVVVNLALKTLGAKTATVTHYSDDRADLRITYSEGYDLETMAEWRKLTNDQKVPITIAAREGKPVFVRSLEAAHLEFPEISAAIALSGEQAYAALPLIIDRRVTGAFGLGFSRAKEFKKSEEQFMLTLAGVVAQAYDRAYLYEKAIAARSAAEAASAAKNHFLGSVSHEVRTPLTAIMGFAELLQKPRANAQTYIDGIIRHSLSLIHILDDFLDLSAAEAGKLRIANEQLVIRQLIDDVFATVQQVSSKTTVHLSSFLDSTVPTTIISDPTRLKQVLLNVVGNALKFTDFGTVQLEVTNAAALSATGAPQICFKVSDSGIGMGTEDSAMVFEPFSQAFNPSAERPRGRGLGLTIGHRIAAALGGSLQLVKTEIGEGSVFMLTVPVQPAAQDKSQKKRPQSQALANRLLGKVLLVAEDQFDILHLLQAHLEQAGARVLTAANGQEAVDLAKGHTIDLAIMDLQMPLLDGYEAAEKLRANGFKGPLLALSAHILDEHRAKALGLGFSAHLAKPVSAEHLIQAVESLLNGAPTSPSVKPTKS